MQVSGGNGASAMIMSIKCPLLFFCTFMHYVVSVAL